MRDVRLMKTPAGVSYELKTYLTVREMRAVTAAPLKFAQVGFETGLDADGNMAGKPEVKGYDLAASIGAGEDALLEQAVASLDGSTENVIGRLLDLRSEEHAAILAEAKKLIEDPRKPE